MRVEKNTATIYALHLNQIEAVINMAGVWNGTNE
jgi:hypothetical protein